mmetsp:Transcript_86467/g.149609  ORF Transcript_86467/g.149609 Transcript_86467/m.149609 type:complete len:133 (+) Transcript_86467:2-400(+)
MKPQPKSVALTMKQQPKKVAAKAQATPVKRLVQSVAAAAPEPDAKKVKKHDLPRERLTTIPTTGDVLSWKKAFGWINPHEPVDHPKASMRKGQVFVSKKDLVGMSELTTGQIVQFHVFADESGLGAEECSAF